VHRSVDEITKVGKADDFASIHGRSQAEIDAVREHAFYLDRSVTGRENIDLDAPLSEHADKLAFGTSKLTFRGA
jgi:hypothetical protein